MCCPDQRTSDILLNMIDERLSMPIKRLGPVDLFNGINIEQTKYYIKLSCETFIERICERHLAAWMKDGKIAKDCPLRLNRDREG